MRVLIACEESQEVCKAFRARGHEAFSCDLQECSGGHPEWHLKGDTFHFLSIEDWDLVIAHPPCTRLCNSGVRWLEERNLWVPLIEAMGFFNKFIDWYNEKPTRRKLAIENPIPHKYAVDGFLNTWWDGDDMTGRLVQGIGEYTQLIQPWQFGDPEQKATCLWLYGLPKLKWSNYDTLYESRTVVDGRNQTCWKMAPSPDRAKLRSKTFPGIARAMAEQWG
jgi:hypothetical protein